VKVFQRTPGWVLPRLDVPMPRPVQDLFTKVPAAQQLARQALFWGHEASATALVWNTPLTSLVARLGKMHLRVAVKDPWLRRQLTPDFVPGCKRMLVSSDYYPALQRDNCKLIDWPIATLSPVGIRTSDGVEHHLDCIVFATGYDVHLTGPPFPVTGLGGRSLNTDWTEGAQAYKSINVHGYPNLFVMTGPNSGPGHNSLLVYIEGQLDYAVRGITTILDNNLCYLDVRADVQRRHNQRIQQRLAKTTWMSGCRSWYLTKDGFNASMYPGFATQYLRQMRDFRFADYDAVAQPSDVSVSSSA
jgi:cation diffusion facilitator CzcD-associated flavoprotein CzcO